MSTLMAAGGGVLLGMFFYGGLWLTVHALTTTTHPVMLTLSSFWLRTAAVLAGFLFVARLGWASVVACLAGFAAGRVVVSAALRREKCT